MPTGGQVLDVNVVLEIGQWTSKRDDRRVHRTARARVQQPDWLCEASNAEEHKERKKLRNQIKRWQREYEELENQIMELEEQIEELDAQMFEAASDLKLLQDLTNQKSTAEDTLEKSMERWEELGEQLAEFEE